MSAVLLAVVLSSSWWLLPPRLTASPSSFLRIPAAGDALQSSCPLGSSRSCLLRLRGGAGGRLYVTDADLTRAGIDPDFDPEFWEYENWPAIQRSKKETPDLPEPLWSWLTEPVAEQGDGEDGTLTPLQHAVILAQKPHTFHPIEELKKNHLVEVLGIAFDGTFDNETTTIMQIRLSIERADYHALRRSMHNACELPFWTKRLDEAFNIGRRIMEYLYPKEDSRFHLKDSPESGRQWVPREELYGLRAPIPERLAETEATYADLMMGPRDGTTRLRVDTALTMDENMALWDALDSERIATVTCPEVADLAFDDEALETIYQTKVAGPPETYHPTVKMPWPALKKLALERAVEAKTHGERGECVGSAWYRAERRADCELEHTHIWQPFNTGNLSEHTCPKGCTTDHQHRYAHLAAIRLRAPATACSCVAEPDRGVWWYLHGAVVRKPALLWRNGRYTWDPEEVEDPVTYANIGQEQCWHCFAADCPHLLEERRRFLRARRWSAMKAAGYPPPPTLERPLQLAKLAALAPQELNLRLHTAVRNMSTRLVALCVEAGAEVEWLDAVGMNALHVAAATGCAETTEALLLLGALPDARTHSNATALHFAADRGATLVAEVLLQYGALVNAQDEHNNTPLHLSADEDWNATCSLLCRRGADVWIANKEGDYPLNIAERLYACPTSMLLRKAMGLVLCECHACAGCTTGYNNMMQPHVTHPQTNREWRDTFDPKEWHPKPFWEEMQEAEDEADAYTEAHLEQFPEPLRSPWEPMNETFIQPGEIPNASWYMEYANNEFAEFWERYYDRYPPGDAAVAEPAPEALRLYEEIQKKEAASIKKN